MSRIFVTALVSVSLAPALQAQDVAAFRPGVVVTRSVTIAHGGSRPGR